MRAIITYSQDTHISYITHSYTTLRVKSTILRWPLVPLSMHRKSSDHLKVTWYIVRLKKIWSTKIWSTKISMGEGFRLSAHGLYVYDQIKGNCVRATNYLRSIKALNEKIPTTHLPPPPSKQASNLLISLKSIKFNPLTTITIISQLHIWTLFKHNMHSQFTVIMVKY